MFSNNKILIFWEQEDLGGVDTHLALFLNSNIVNKENFTIEIVTNYNNLGLTRLLDLLDNKNKIKVTKYFSFLNYQSNFRLLNYLKFIFHPVLFLISLIQSYFLLRNKNISFFIGHCGGYGLFRSEMAAIISAKLCKIPVRSLVIHHECVYPNLWKNIINIINYFVAKSATSVISVSNATKNSIKLKSNLFDANSNLENLVIYNGVSVNTISQKNIFTNSKYNINPTDIKIGTLSRIEPNKGLEDLIYAASILTSEFKIKLKIILVGKGDEIYINKLKKIISYYDMQDVFIFTGFLECKSNLILSSFDLFISLSRNFEGFCYSVAESLSVGTPVITTSVGGIKEYLNDNFVDLIEPNDFLDLNKKIIKFINMKELFQKKALLAKQHIKDNFNSEIMSKNYIEHLKKKIINSL